MIIVKLMGGMGNQMFQYSFGKFLSYKYNLPLKIDLSFLKNRNMGPNFVYRDYDLDLFNISEDFDIRPTKSVYLISEPKFDFSDRIIEQLEKLDGHFYINGYWQSYKYFEPIIDQIVESFELKKPIMMSGDIRIIEMLNQIKNNNSVLINIRRTDYLNTDFHGVLSNDYVMKGIDIIKNKVDNPHYFIFSDDIQWCRDNIKIENMTIVDHSYKGDRFGWYLELMKSCKHFIIPNSTFAWWSAFLNQSNDKIVIAPKKWFNDPTIITDDLIPKNWIRI